MALFKKKYETIECSSEHLFRIDFDGVIKVWKCVVGDSEVIAYENDVETARIPMETTQRAPQVLQIDTIVNVYGEELGFQLENGFPFLCLEGDWEPSDTFAEAKRNAAVKMYRRNSFQQIGLGCVLLVALLLIWIVKKDVGDMWILSVFGIFFISSGAYTLVRVRNELQAIRDAEAEEAARADEDEVDAIAAARALHAGKEEQ